MERRLSGWRPPHCPNPNCSYFHSVSPEWPFTRKGFYRRKHSPQCIQRFTCRQCRRTFSCQTFSTTYWQKRPKLIAPILLMVVGGMANRQIARALGCSHSTVAHHIARLGRHCLLFHVQELGRITPPRTIAIDGFETFEWSQYFPFHHNVAVDVDSGYFLFHTDSPLRRKGRMTPQQKARRAELEATLGRPDPKAVERGVRELLEVVTSAGLAITIRSDDHHAYPRAMVSLACGLSHQVTPSKQRRNAHNPLWEVNLLDLLIRHSTAAHKRETIAFSKRRQASAEKLSILQVWRNTIKKRREKGRRVTSAMLIGTQKRPLRVRDVLARRLFFEKTEMPPRWKDYYRRRVTTRALRVNRTHELVFAF